MLPVPNSVRLVSISAEPRLAQNLNAPFGAQCFPTREEAQGAGLENLSQCTFWCPALSDLSSVPDGWSKDRIVSQCTFWCSVLSDMEDRFAGYWKFLDGTQCTFWCSVLSDLDGLSEGQRATIGLNAPSGAQCFPTHNQQALCLRRVRGVSMHLLVLSAFRPVGYPSSIRYIRRSQCTFWCSVLSDLLTRPSEGRLRVSMHLLVLSAFRRLWTARRCCSRSRSQCTFWCSVLSDLGGLVLKMWPILSQCTFWCSVLSDAMESTTATSAMTVSMHLLVLSAFRPRNHKVGSVLLFGVSMHLLVLSAFRLEAFLAEMSVASLNAPSGAQCFPTPPPENRATTPFTGTKSPPTWKAPHRIGPHLSN